MAPEKDHTVDAVPVVAGYALYVAIGSGGTASVHAGRRVEGGESPVVAIKRLHPQLAADPELVVMLLDEAQIAARIEHPNVVRLLDVVEEDREVLLVMELCEGESLARLLASARARGERIPVGVLVAIVAGTLRGLHAAHEAKIVHRDVSPSNVLVGLDGVARVLDFGVAKAVGRLVTTRDGKVKGKLAYMAPEQLRGGRMTRRTDVYAAGVVLWEGLTGRRLFRGDDEQGLVEQVLLGYIDAPGIVEPSIPEALDAVAMRALERDPEARFATALEMAEALERAAAPASVDEVAAWVERSAGAALSRRAARIAQIQGDLRSGARREDVRDAERPRRRRGSGAGAAALAGALALVLGGAAAYRFRTPGRPEPPAAPPAMSSEAEPPPAVLPPPSVAPAPPASASATRVLAPAKPRPPPAPPTKKACRAPFTFDSTGRKIYNRDCL